MCVCLLYNRIRNMRLAINIDFNFGLDLLFFRAENLHFQIHAQNGIYILESSAVFFYDDSNQNQAHHPAAYIGNDHRCAMNMCVEPCKFYSVSLYPIFRTSITMCPYGIYSSIYPGPINSIALLCTYQFYILRKTIKDDV